MHLAISPLPHYAVLVINLLGITGLICPWPWRDEVRFPSRGDGIDSWSPGNRLPEASKLTFLTICGELRMFSTTRYPCMNDSLVM